MKNRRTSTFKYILENDKISTELCSCLLWKTNLYQTKYENDIIKHLVEQVRNRCNNPRPINEIVCRAKTYANQLKKKLLESIGKELKSIFRFFKKYLETVLIC
jgi:predicted DNA-binding protein (UPF0278 family)